MVTRVVGVYELGAPFGAVGCGMAMHAVLAGSHAPRTAIILSPRLVADAGAPPSQAGSPAQAQHAEQRLLSIDVTIEDVAGRAASGNSSGGGGDSSNGGGGDGGAAPAAMARTVVAIDVRGCGVRR